MKRITKVVSGCVLVVAAAAAYAGSVQHIGRGTSPVIASDPASLNTMIDINERLMALVALLSKPEDDNVRFCYFDGEPYSEGAIREGRVCRRWADRPVDGGAGVGNGQRQLVWADK